MVIEGLSVDKIKTISKLKNETEDVLEFRLKSYEKFKNMPLPSFGPSLDIDFDKIMKFVTITSSLTYKMSGTNNVYKSLEP